MSKNKERIEDETINRGDEQLLNQKVKEQVLQQLCVSSTEKVAISSLVSTLLNRLKSISDEKSPYSIEFRLGGSYAKNTFLKNDFDVDIFCIFYDSIDDEEKFNIINTILQESNVVYSIEYGSRKYFSGIFKNTTALKGITQINFECVPTQYYTNPYNAQNSTDLSIHHVEFVKKKVKNNRALCDEIRLAKQWFKAHELYGAESYINGFSGHGIECLVIQLQSFTNVISYLSKMKKGDVFTFTNSSRTYLQILSRDKYSPLLIQDPIINNRNALSALGEDIFYRAKFEAIKAQNSSFSVDDFQISAPTTQEELFNSLFTNSQEMYLGIKISVKRNDKSRDVIGSRCKKIINKLSKRINKEGFTVIFEEFTFSYTLSLAYGKIIINSYELSPLYYQKGPSLTIDIPSVEQFLAKHPLEHISSNGSNLFVEKKRIFTTINQFINAHNSTSKILEYVELNEEDKCYDIELFTNPSLY